MTAPSSTQFAPLKRMYDQLIAAKVDEETAAFLLGRVTLVAQEAMGLKLAATLGAEKYKELQKIADEEARAAAMGAAYLEKTGTSTENLFEEMLEKVVQDFEKS